MIFSKKKEQFVPETIPEVRLANLPIESRVGQATSTIQEETIEWYLIEKKYVRTVDGKPFYPISDLIRLRSLGQANHETQEWSDWRIDIKSEPRGYAHFNQYTSGKERLFVIWEEYHIRIKPGDSYSSHEWQRQKSYNGYLVDETTGQTTFYPAFFRLLGLGGYQLLKIQAPRQWHEEMARRPFVDPEITVEWNPEV